MSDLSLPAGWTSEASVGWRAMHYATTGEEPPEPRWAMLRPGVMHPTQFSLTVSGFDNHGDRFDVYLLFLVVDATKEINLFAVLSPDADVDAPLDALRSHRPIYWWKHKALMQFVEQDSRDIVGVMREVATPEDVAEFERLGRERLKRIRQISTRRHRNKISDGRLDEVAAVYRAAESKPTLAVAETLHVSHSHAAHLVGQARKAGKLPPAKGTSPKQ